MTSKETCARDASSININSRRFFENLTRTTETYKFCISLSQNPRVTGQIIKRLAQLGIDE